MAGIVEQAVDRAFLDHLACIHDGHAVAKFGNDAKVMGDDDDGPVETAAQVAQKVDDLRLHCHVKRGCRFIRDQDIGLHQQGRGNGDTLAHAARKFVRIAVEAALRIGDADAAQHGGQI